MITSIIAYREYQSYSYGIAGYGREAVSASNIQLMLRGTQITRMATKGRHV